MKKALSIIIMVGLVFSMFASCGTSSPSGSSTETTLPRSNSSKEETSVTLTIWHSFTQEDRGDAIQKMADEFTALHDNVTINIEVFPWSTFDTKWKTGLSTGELPDISTALPEGIMAMAQADALLPLNDLIDEMGNPFVEKPFESLSFNNNILAVPFYAHARALWYRTDILEKYNLDVPSNLDELANVAKAITEQGELYGMAVPMSKKDFYGTIYLYLISKNMGGNILTKEGKVDLTSPIMIDSINYLVDMYQNASPEGSINYGDPETNDAFIQGKSAFYFESGFAINRVITGNPEIADCFAALPPLPAVSGKPSGYFADYISFVIWKNNQDEVKQQYAKEFIKFIFENEKSYIDFLHLVPGGMLPTIKSVYDSEEFWDNEIINTHRDDIEIIKQGVENGCPVANDFGPNPATNVIKTQGIIEEMLQSIVLGTMTTEDAAKKAEDLMNSEIAKLN